MAYHQFLDRGHPDDYRREEIQALLQAIRARENRLVLGLPGIGVSNMLRFLVARPELAGRKATFAYLDCDALDDCLDRGVFFAEVARQLAEQGLGDQPEGDKRGYERLKRLVTRVGGDPSRRLVIVVDQANRILAGADRRFYRNLKALTDLNKRVCYLFAAGPLLSDVIDPDNLLFAGRRLAIGRLNARDCANAIIEEAQRLGVEFDPEAQERLASLSGGYPGLLRAVCPAVAAERLDLSDPKGGLVAHFLARGDVKYRCQKIWNALDPSKQAALQLLADGRPDSAGTTALAWLQDFGVVDDHEGEYRFFSPIFQHFVTDQATSLEPITIVGASAIFRNEQEIVVAGKVFKGNREVHVSPLELRLIACLKRERKIYRKDDIAAYVYYEDEGKGEGISDTRIENLVRQVRQRLGDQYIKAHWGKGYELVA
ncbi:MAG: hypothetical protein ACE5H9_13495 [Anaerolineae bacterium]